MPSLLEVPQARGDFVDQVVIVGDQQHRALVALQRDVERVDGFEVQVVGGLIEDQDVGLGEDQLAEDQTRLFAARERLGRLLTFLAGEKHLAQDAADFFDVRLGIPTVQPLRDGQSVLDGGADVLREVADLRLVPPEDGAVVELKSGSDRPG